MNSYQYLVETLGLLLLLLILGTTPVWAQSETKVLTGTLQAGIIRHYGTLELSNAARAEVRIILRLLADGSAELDRAGWPPLSLTTAEGGTGVEPELLTLRLKTVGIGTHQTEQIDTGNGSYTRHRFAFPLNLTLDFASDPPIGEKDQDCQLVLQTTGFPVPQSWRVFGGTPAAASDLQGNISFAGACEIHTWVYWFPASWDKRSYDLGIILSGQLLTEAPQCTALRLQIKELRTSIEGLRGSLNDLDPRSEIDQAEIKKINEEIDRLTQQIAGFKQQSLEFGC